MNRPIRIALPLALIAVLGACAGLPSAPPSTTAYVCDDGREFSVAVASSGSAAIIDIGRMRFSLVAEAATDGAEQFGCGVLTLWRKGDQAKLDMEGTQQIGECRVKR